MKIQIALVCLCALVASSCTELQPAEPERPLAGDAAFVFVEAWDEQDTEGMAELISAESGNWPASKLERFFERITEDGQIIEMQVELTEGVEEPTEEDFEEAEGPFQATAPYEISLVSQAAARPVTLEGEFELLLPAPDDEWEVLWERSLLWPEVDGGVGLAVEYRWLRRGSILDRDGVALARGPIASRRYPHGSVAGTTVGHVAPVPEPEKFKKGEAAEKSDTEVEAEDEEEDEPEFEAAPGDLVGASGLELALQERLAGTPSTKLVVVDRRDRPLEVLGRAKGKPGKDVKTTLDVAVQRAAEQAYGGTTGGSVVMDPSTGDLLAVVSSSAFDPNNYVGVAGIEPFNRALSGRYPPGSSLKVMTAAAALEEKVVKESTTLPGPSEYRGVRNFESGAFGTIDFASALKFSVNTVFAQVAIDLGARRLKRYSDAFGFNTAPAMPLGAATSSFPLPEDEGDVMWGSIGQAQVLASPLTMATIAATIANGGKRMEPRILLRDPKVGERVVSKKTATTMTRLMENVVKGGTGVGAAISGAQVAGKTGTAEVDVAGERKNHAWFIAFAPSTGPKVAVSIVSEYGGVGGQVAAPLAGRILSAVLPQL